MKKLTSTSVVILVTVLLCPPLLFTSNAVSMKRNPAPAGPTIPDSVKVILEKSCYPCHDEPGKGMALGKLNFGKWDSYSPEKQVNKAEDMCEEMQKGKMPPSGFKKNNPDKVPTQKEIETVCAWVKTIEKK